MAVISKSQLADELGVSRARISQYLNEGLPTLSNGKLNREQALNWITGNIIPVDHETDRGTVRASRLLNGAAAQPKCPEWLLPVRDCGNPLAKGVLLGILHMGREIEALGATSALEAGAEIAVAKLAGRFLVHAFLERATDFMRENRFGPFEHADDPAIWRPDDVSMRVDWRKVAKDAGAPYEPKAWEAYASERKTALSREDEAIEEAEAARAKKGGVRKASRSSK